MIILDSLLRDLRHTLRGLLREPLLLLTATASISLGVAGNIAVFSLAQELLFGTPDVRDAHQVVAMRVAGTSQISHQRWRDLDASDALAGVVGFDFGRQVNWFDGDATVAVLSPMRVTANFFDVLGLPMARGRGFSAAEARLENNPHFVVVSHSFWQRELGGDSAVIGRTLILNGESYAITGVLAPKLRSIVGLGMTPRLYISLNPALEPEVLSPTAQRVEVIGRLKPGQSLSTARATLDAVDRRLAQATGDTTRAGVQEIGRVGSLGDSKVRRMETFFGMLSIVSLLVVLIGCGNVAGLLMARGRARRADIAVRLAIGATRSRLVQQLMVEAFWLGALGAAVGLGLSALAMQAVNAMPLPVALPIELNLSVDRSVLLMALGLVFVTMFASALLPALGATRVSLTPALQRQEGRVHPRFTTRAAVLAGQVSVSTVLLVMAFLFLRSLQRSHLTSPGFDVDGILVAEVGLTRATTQPAQQQANLFDVLVERARELPGVASVAVAAGVPLTLKSGSSSGRSLQFDGGGQPRNVEFVQLEVSPNYFATMGIRLLGGRDFGPDDRPGAPPTVIVNEEFARRYLDGKALGRRFTIAGTRSPVVHEIVGVVANSKSRTIGEELRGAIYVPLAQRPAVRSVAFVIARTSGDEPNLVRSLEAALGAVDRSVSVDVQPLRAALAFALLPSRLGAAVLGGVGLLGLVLAAFGLLALVSYTVTLRMREIAVRAALGASQRHILRLVMRDALLVVGVGVFAGLGIAAATTRGIAAFLVAGLSATDPLSFVGTAVVFLLVTLVASWIPARNAMRVAPALAMRVD